MPGRSSQRWLRSIFLRSRLPLLCKEGNMPQAAKHCTSRVVHLCSERMRTTMTFFRLSLLVFFVSGVAAQTDTSPDALFSAIRRAAAAEVERLLKAGVSPNLVDPEGTPALMAAALFSTERVMQVLLEHGADPNRAGASGTTA